MAVVSTDGRRTTSHRVRCCYITERELAIVPRGVWHRLVVEQPCRFLFLTPSRTEVRVPPEPA
jgi:hypothetical protein